MDQSSEYSPTAACQSKHGKLTASRRATKLYQTAPIQPNNHFSAIKSNYNKPSTYVL